MGADENLGLNIFIVRGDRSRVQAMEDSLAWTQKKEEIRSWLVTWRTFFREDAPMYREAAETCERLLQLDPPTSQGRAGRILLSLGEALIQRASAFQAQPLPPVTREALAAYLTGELLRLERAEFGDYPAYVERRALLQLRAAFFGE